MYESGESVGWRLCKASVNNGPGLGCIWGFDYVQLVQDTILSLLFSMKLTLISSEKLSVSDFFPFSSFFVVVIKSTNVF